MDAKQGLTVYHEFGLLMSRELSALTEEDTLILTTNIEVFRRLADDHRTFVGLTQSFITINLEVLLRRERLKKFVVVVSPHERTDAHFFLGVHAKWCECFAVLDRTNFKTMFNPKEWIVSILKSEVPGRKLWSIRKRAKILIDSLRHAAIAMPPAELLVKYEEIFSDMIRKDDFLKALALDHVRVKPLYDTGKKKLLSPKTHRRQRIMSIDQMLRNIHEK